MTDTTLDELTTLVDARHSHLASEAMAARTALLTRLASLTEERDRWKEQASDNARHGFAWQDKAARLEEALRRLVKIRRDLDDFDGDKRGHVESLYDAYEDAAALLSPSGPLTAPKVWEQPPYVDGEAVPCHLCGAAVFVKRDGTYRERVAPAVDGDIHDCRAAPSGESSTPATRGAPITADAVLTVRRIAGLLYGYRDALRHGSQLHANDLGDDPEQLERAAAAIEAVAALKESEVVRAANQYEESLDDDVRSDGIAPDAGLRAMRRALTDFLAARGIVTAPTQQASPSDAEIQKLIEDWADARDFMNSIGFGNRGLGDAQREYGAAWEKVRTAIGGLRSRPPSSSERRDEVTDEKMGLVRLILEGFRDTPNPSIDIALEEIMMTFEQGYIGRPGQARIVKDEDAMTLLIDAESWLYHSTTQEERWPIAAKVRAFVRERRGNDPWRDSQRIETPPTGQRPSDGGAANG